ncbi:Uncharacterised protein [uncultured archaeon]|nr:Uncharacterised protein [uncultured archaeon]
MLFDLSNYWIFVVFIAAIYVAISTFAQNNVGGKGRLRAIQAELKEVQKRMTDSAKANKEKEMNEAMNQNWKLAMEMMAIQMQMLVALMVVFVLALAIFNYMEPGKSDDITLQLYDDGLLSHCDALAGDGIFSNCYAIPANVTKGAWAIDGLLFSPTGEQLAKSGLPVYIEGGESWQVLVANTTQNSWIDGLQGKVPHYVNITSDKQNYTVGETVQIRASAYTFQGGLPVLQKDLQGGKLEAVLDAGTFFYYDPPFPIPLINVRRIIGSSGFFIFSAFLLGIAYSIAKSAIQQAKKLLKK